jgi:hypothetical protein
VSAIACTSIRSRGGGQAVSGGKAVSGGQPVGAALLRVEDCCPVGTEPFAEWVFSGVVPGGRADKGEINDRSYGFGHHVSRLSS